LLDFLFANPLPKADVFDYLETPRTLRPQVRQMVRAPPGDTVSDALEQAIKTIPCAAVCFGPADTGKWHITEIRAYVEHWASKEARMIPVILPHVDDAPDLPFFVRQTLWVDLRDWEIESNDGF
jgi:hypothetical protein